MIGVLLLHRALAASAITAGMTAALKVGWVDPEVVAVEARRSLEPPGPAPAVIVPIGARMAHRPPPSLAGYDELLSGAGR